MTDQEQLEALQTKIAELKTAKNEYEAYLDLIHRFGKHLEPTHQPFELSLAVLNFCKAAVTTGKHISHSILVLSPFALLYDEIIRATPSHLVCIPMFASIITSTAFMMGEIIMEGIDEAWWRTRSEQNIVQKTILPKPIQNMLVQAANNGNLFIGKFLNGDAKPTELLDDAIKLEQKIMNACPPSRTLFRQTEDLLNQIMLAELEARTDSIRRLTDDIEDKVQSAQKLGLVI